MKPLCQEVNHYQKNLTLKGIEIAYKSMVIGAK